MRGQVVEDFKFQNNDSPQARTMKLEALRLSTVKASFTATGGDWPSRLSDKLETPNVVLTPDVIPTLSFGTVVTVEGQGEVFQFDAPKSLGTRSWLAVADGSKFRAAYRVRILSGASSPVVGFFVYSAQGYYLGSLGQVEPDDAITVDAGWVEYESRATKEEVLAAFPEAAFVRSSFFTGNTANRFQIASARIEDLADSVDIDDAVAAAEEAAAAALAAALAGAGSAETAAGYATVAQAWADAATGQAGAAQASAVAAQSFADDADVNAQASSTHASSALTSANAAGASAAAAEISRISAQAANTSSTTQAGIATTKAAAADASAASALSSETLSASYSAASQLAASQQIPSDFQQGGTFFFNGYDGLPENVGPLPNTSVFTYPVVTGVGKVLSINSNSQIDVGTKGALFIVPGHTYRVSARARRTNGSSVLLDLYHIGVVADGSSSVSNGASGSSFALATVNQWYDYTHEVSGDTLIAAGAAYIRATFRKRASTSTIVQFAYIELEDITDAKTLQAQVTTNAGAIADTNTALATLTTEVAASASTNPNLIGNATAENGTVGWSSIGSSTLSANVSNSGNGGRTYFRVATSTLARIWAISDRVRLNTSSGGGYATLTGNMGQNGSGVVNYRWVIICYDTATGGTETGRILGPLTNSHAFRYSKVHRDAVKCTGPIPAGTTYAAAFLEAWGTAGTAHNMDFNAVKLETGQVNTSFTQEASVTESFSALATAQGKLEAYWQVTAVAGGRAQLKVFADANGGAGVDIIGDVRIDGTNFAIYKNGGGQRTEYSAGAWRVYDTSGTLRTRMGVW